MEIEASTNQDLKLSIRDSLAEDYADIYTPEALEALTYMAQFNAEQKSLMNERTQRRAKRMANKTPITFLDPESEIKGTGIKVQDARDGNFIGAVIPHDLQRQWLQGTGPAAKPNASVKSSLRNVAYALLSGLMAGCSMAKMPSAKSQLCHSIINAASSWPSPKTLCFLKLQKRSLWK